MPSPRLRLAVLITLLVSLGVFWGHENLVVVDVLRTPDNHLFYRTPPFQSDLRALRREENIDGVIRRFTDDFSRLKALSQWTSRQFPVGNPFPNYPPWNARQILRDIRSGATGGFCAQYALVFGQAAQSLGYWIRYVDLKDPDNSTHFLPEAFLPDQKKWVAFEPQTGTYVHLLDQTPLSALDVHLFLNSPRGKADRQRKVPSSINLFEQVAYYRRNNFTSLPARVAIRRTNTAIYFQFSPSKTQWRNNKDLNPDPGSFDFQIKDRMNGHWWGGRATFEKMAKALKPGEWGRLVTTMSALRHHIESDTSLSAEYIVLDETTPLELKLDIFGEAPPISLPESPPAVQWECPLRENNNISPPINTLLQNTNRL